MHFSRATRAASGPELCEAGVIGPLPGVIGAMMAVEAVKLLTDAGTPLLGQMVIYDALHGESRRIAIAPRKGCEICAKAQGQTERAKPRHQPNRA